MKATSIVTPLIYYLVSNDIGNPDESVDCTMYLSMREALALLRKTRQAGYPAAYLVKVTYEPCDEPAVEVLA